MPTARKPSENPDATTDVLVLYRLQLVEAAVKEVGDKVDKQENIKKADLVEFRDTILARFNEIRDGLQDQIDKKADQKDVDDIKTLIKALGTIFGSVITALVVYYFTTGRK